jgi:hypothetical protein
MAEMNARERHKAEIQSVKAELKRLRKGTPHQRDMERRLHRLQKELRIYDFYMSSSEKAARA